MEFRSTDVLLLLMQRFGSRLVEDCNSWTCKVWKLGNLRVLSNSTH